MPSSAVYPISLLVSNKPAVLIRIALVFSRRGYNLESVVVSPSQDPKFSWMNLVASGDPKTLAQIIRQLNKLVDVIHAREHGASETIQRELALVKVSTTKSKRGALLEIAGGFKAEVVDDCESNVTLQAVGTTEELDALREELAQYTILEFVRSGKLVIARGVQET